MTSIELLIDGLDFGEGPRWHNGLLWYSDFFQHRVYTVSLDGKREVILDLGDEFGKRVRFIIDGGKSKIGLESTVVNLVDGVKINRPGAISKKDLYKVFGKKISLVKKINKINSPGMLRKHYSPGIPIVLNCKIVDSKDAFIVFGKKYKKGKNIFNLSYKGDL